MIVDPADLLFREPLSSSRGPLFATRTDLAEAITKIRDGDFCGRKFESIRAFLSQVLKPANTPNGRPLSPSLRGAILEAAKLRLHSEIRFESFTEDLDFAFSKLKSAPQEPLSLDNQFWKLEKEAKAAKIHFITTFEPAESTDSRYAVDLKETMTETLGLTGPREHLDENTVKYIFCLPNENIAHKLWKDLYMFLAYSKRNTDANDRLSFVNSVEKETLQVFTVRPEYCVYPSVIFDPDSPAVRGFVLYYHSIDGEQWASVASMSSQGLQHWRDNIYLPIYNGAEESLKKEITWKDASRKLKILK